MYEESLVGVDGHVGSWRRGSLIRWLKSGRLKPTTKGSKGVRVTTLLGVLLVGAP